MHRCPRLDDALQGFLLELFILLAYLDQLGQFIVPLLEQHINIRPRLGDSMLARDQPVIQHDAIDADNDQQTEQHGIANGHGFLLRFSKREQIVQGEKGNS